jgi:hypothetical protein
VERGYLPVEKFVFTTEGGEWRPLSKN